MKQFLFLTVLCLVFIQVPMLLHGAADPKPEPSCLLYECAVSPQKQFDAALFEVAGVLTRVSKELQPSLETLNRLMSLDNLGSGRVNVAASLKALREAKIADEIKAPFMPLITKVMYLKIFNDELAGLDLNIEAAMREYEQLVALKNSAIVTSAESLCCEDELFCAAVRLVGENMQGGQANEMVELARSGALDE